MRDWRVMADGSVELVDWSMLPKGIERTSRSVPNWWTSQSRAGQGHEQTVDEVNTLVLAALFLLLEFVTSENSVEAESMVQAAGPMPEALVTTLPNSKKRAILRCIKEFANFVRQ